MWSDRKCYLVSIRMGIFVGLIVGLFWLVWSFYAPVPVVTYPGLSLNFPISRWTDIIFAPLLVGGMVTLYGKTEKKADFVFGFVIGFVAAVFNWAIFSVHVPGPVGVTGLVLGFVFGLFKESGYKTGFVLGFGYGIVINPGLVLVDVLGVDFVFGFMLAIGLIWVLRHLKPFFKYLIGEGL